MRQYSRVVPRFWTGPTGKRIREAGRDAQVLALYLFTGPQSTMTGLYYLPLPTLCYEAGYTEDEARRTILKLAEVKFVHYDFPAELVWVVEAARYQVAEALVPSDKRVTGILRELMQFRGHRFARLFYAKYKKSFSLPVIEFPRALRRPSKGPSKPGERTRTGAGTGERTPPIPPAGAGGDALVDTSKAESGAQRSPRPGAVRAGHGSCSGKAEPGAERSPATERPLQATAAERAKPNRARNDPRSTERRAQQEAVNYLIAKGERAWRPVRRTLLEWIRAGLTLDEVKARIDLGEHIPRAPM